MKLVHELFTGAALATPNKKAIISPDGDMTYKELSFQVDCYANWLIKQGVKKGDRVVIVLPSSIPVVCLLFAISKVGAIFVIINYEMRALHLEHVIGNSEPVLLITDKNQNYFNNSFNNHLDNVRFIEDILADTILSEKITQLSVPTIDQNDLCSLLYTSGSTGFPKAIVSTHTNIMFSTEKIQSCIKIESDDIIGNFLPLSFDYGLYQVFLALQVGATITLLDYKQSGLQLLKNIVDYGITGLPVVPNLALNLLKLLKRSHSVFDQLRFITNTGAKLPVKYINELRLIMPKCKIYLMYGLTECKRVSILDADEINDKMESVGKPLPETLCWIVDEHNNILPPGRIGELVVQGPHVMQGYWRNQALTDQRFKEWGPEKQKVLFTGDYCLIDSEGYLYFHGRLDDVFKRNGFRVSVIEIENACLNIAGVEQAVMLISSEENRNVLLVEESSAQLKIEGIQRELALRLEPYKMPSKIEIIKSFPLLSNGKVDKKRLKRLLL